MYGSTTADITFQISAMTIDLYILSMHSTFLHKRYGNLYRAWNVMTSGDLNRGLGFLPFSTAVRDEGYCGDVLLSFFLPPADRCRTESVSGCSGENCERMHLLRT